LSPIVILDEPSSALDPIAEYTMFNNMLRACEGRTLVFISHRLSSAVLADRVILLDGGRICEKGSHEELMRANGPYAEMFRKQAENYVDTTEQKGVNV
ncbi:MAG: ABC transporter ATP-binding protein, partial [Clostridia bacterium]|nr:ABC transporter ATP-binding protein [Clostridia bacterium]